MLRTLIQFTEIILKFPLQWIFSLLGRIPESWMIPTGKGGGLFAYFILIRRRQIAFENLSLAFPEKSKIEIKKLVKENFIHLGIMFLEFLHLPRWKGQLLQKCRIEGVDNLHKAMTQGKGVLFPVSHFGNWEMGGAVLAEYGYRVVAVARPLDQGWADEILNNIRRRMGLEVITKRDAVRGILEALKEGAIVAVLVDQHAGKRGVEVPFFNRPVSMYPTVITIARRTGCPILSGYLIRKGRTLSYEGRFEKPFELLKQIDDSKNLGEELEDKGKTITYNTARLAALLENQIRRCPEQWLWAHRRWRKLKLRGKYIL